MSGHFGEPASSNGERGDEPFVFTSVRYDIRLLRSDQNTQASCNKPCPFYLFEHHWTRLQIAKWSTFFFAEDRPRPNSGGPAGLLQTLLKATKHWQENHPGEQPECLRVKLKLYVGGQITTEIYHPLKSIPMTSLFPETFNLPPTQRQTEWTIVLDTEPTEPGEGTMFKTSDRSSYARAREQAEILTFQTPKEVLLFRPDRNILDGSICTPYFYRDGRWVTPSSSEGGLQGTTRRWALENKLCVEDSVCIDSLVEGEIVWLSNAVRGYFWAVFQSSGPPRNQPDAATIR